MGDRSQHRVSLKASVFFIGGVISQRLFVHAGSEKKRFREMTSIWLKVGVRFFPNSAEFNCSLRILCVQVEL